MIRLDSTLRKLEAVLSGAVATTQPSFVASWSDASSSDYTGGVTPGNMNGVTPVTVVAAPAASIVRDVDCISFVNKDSAAVVLTINLNDNANLYPIFKATLAIGDVVTYTHGDGWKVTNSSGQQKTSSSVGSLYSMKNKLINGEVTRINQRGVANWAAVSNGNYGYDRWKKVDASNMTQIIEAGNFRPSTVHTLSGVGVTTQQITSPASGDWTLPNIPIAATNVQVEEGLEATPFEVRHIGFELALCQRYYENGKAKFTGYQSSGGGYGQSHPFKVTKRKIPTMTQSGATGTNVTNMLVESNNLSSFGNSGYATTTGIVNWECSWYADAEL